MPHLNAERAVFLSRAACGSPLAKAVPPLLLRQARTVQTPSPVRSLALLAPPRSSRRGGQAWQVAWEVSAGKVGRPRAPADSLGPALFARGGVRHFSVTETRTLSKLSEELESEAKWPGFVREVWNTICSTLRENLVPTVISVAATVALVLAYKCGGEAMRHGFDRVAQWERDWGVGFAALATMITAGLLPLLLQAALGRLPRPFLPNLLFNLVFWAVQGIFSWVLVELNAKINGQGQDALTIFKKLLFENLVFAPLFAYPLLILPGFRFKDSGFSCRRFVASWGDRRNVLLVYCSMVVADWCTFIPASSIIYSFPYDLQLPITVFLLFFFSSFLSIMSANATVKDPIVAPNKV